MATIRDKRRAEWFWMNKAIMDDYGPKIGSHGIAVYAFLCRCANEQGHAIPSIRFIARQVNLSTNTVMKYLDILSAYHLIECKRRVDDAGDLTSTEYILLHPDSLEDSVGVSTSETPVSVVETGVSTVETPVSTSETPCVVEVSQPLRQVSQQLRYGVSTTETFQDPLNKKREEREDPPLPPMGAETPAAKPKRPRVQSQYTPGFLAWWSVYPATRRVSKPACFERWQADGLEPRSAELVAKIERLIVTAWKHKEPHFIKTSLPYLNEGRYDDDLVPLPEFPAREDTGLSAIGYQNGLNAYHALQKRREHHAGHGGQLPALPGRAE